MMTKKISRFIFLVLLFIAPLNSGNFFVEQFWILALISALLLFYVLKTQGGVDFGLPGLLLIFLSGSYFVSFLGAASPYQAYIGFLKYIFYFVIYVLTVTLWVEDKDKVLLTMVGAITVATVLTILAQAQLLGPTNFIFRNRWGATFHYPNAYAIVLVVVLILNIYLSVVTTKKWARFLLLATWFLNTVAFYATLSRGSFLFYFPALFLLLFCLEKKHRLFVLGNLCLINGLTLVCTDFILQNPNPQTIMVLILGLTVLLLLNLVVELKIVPPGYLAGVLLVLVLVGGIFVVKYYPEKVTLTELTRLTEISLETTTVGFRYYVYVDALKIFQKHWLIGTGGGGWQALYKTIQGHLYNSTEAHSSVLQTMVESGLFGTVFFLGIFGYVFMQQIWRRQKQKNTPLLRVVFLAVMVLFLHSCIDLELTFASISMYLFVLVALLGSEYNCKLSRHKLIKFVAMVLVVILLFSSLSMGLAHLYARQPLANIKTNSPFKALPIPHYERNLALAQKLSPLNPLYTSYLGLIKIAKGIQQKSPGEVKSGLQCLERAIELSPYEQKAYLTKALILSELQKKDEASVYFEKVITLIPMQHVGYVQTLRHYVALTLQTGEPKYLALARQVYPRTLAQMQKVAPERLSYWRKNEKLTENPATNFYAGIAEFLAGEYYRANKHFRLPAKKASGLLQEEAKAWLVVTQKKLNKTIDLGADPQEVEHVENLLRHYREAQGEGHE